MFSRSRDAFAWAIAASALAAAVECRSERYLQLDDCSFAYLCDPAQRKMLEERGENWQTQGEIYAGMINSAIAEKPKDKAPAMPGGGGGMGGGMGGMDF